MAYRSPYSSRSDGRPSQPTSVSDVERKKNSTTINLDIRRSRSACTNMRELLEFFSVGSAAGWMICYHRPVVRRWTPREQRKDQTIMRWIFGAVAAAALSFSVEAEAEAEACAVTVEVRDALDFSLKEITVDSSCEAFTLTLKHVGKMPVSAMGHNWVLTRTEDFNGAVTD